MSDTFINATWWNGSFNSNNQGASFTISNNNMLGSDDVKKQTIEYDNDNTATVMSYNVNAQGVDDTPDEIMTFNRQYSDEFTGWPQEEVEAYLAFLKESGYEYSAQESEEWNLSDIQFNVDKKIDYFKQGQLSDCVYLACLISVAQNEIEEAISKNNDGSYSVTFKGMNSSYNISQQELFDARMCGKYSNGDNTVLLLEVAAQKALQELKSNGFDNSNEYKKKLYQICSAQNNFDISYFNLQKFMLLFGLSTQTPSPISINKDNGNARQKIEDANLNNNVAYMSFSSDAVMNSDNGNDFYISPHHAYAIKNYDSSNRTITLINPYNSSDSLTMNVEDIEQYNATLDSLSYN